MIIIIITMIIAHIKRNSDFNGNEKKITVKKQLGGKSQQLNYKK